MSEQAPIPKISVPPLRAWMLGFSTAIVQGPRSGRILALPSFDGPAASLASQGACQDSVSWLLVDRQVGLRRVRSKLQSSSRCSLSRVAHTLVNPPEPQFLSLHG